MKKYATLLLVCTLLFSCKNTSSETEQIAESDAQTENDEVKMNNEPLTISLAQWSYHLPIQKGEMDAMDFAEKAKELGFDNIEYVDQLYAIDPNKPYKEEVMRLAAAWKEKNEEFEVNPNLIMIDTAGELADPSEEKRKAAVEMHKAWVDAAVEIGCPAIRVNLFGYTEIEPWHKASVASLKELGAYALEKNIKVLPENHAQLSNNPELMVSVIDEVNLSSVGTLPDFGNWCVLREGGDRWNGPCLDEYDRYKGIKLLLPFAGGVSAKSNDFDENGDETTTDYYKMMQILKDANFSGIIGVEYENEEYMDPTEGILATKALIIKAHQQAN
ncbi:MAG: TIM barrel protein [Flavobacteriaceae bacterium]|nr:TIM barrel protein [Flavobacteriaceae bacterium]